MFGNLNNMVSIWVTGQRDKCKAIKNHDEEFYKFEKENADKIIKEESVFHEGL